jgi:hypothetical protein
MTSFRAEVAAARKLHFGQSLLDLVKAFERLPHDCIIRAARKLGYCMTTLRLSLAAYRLPRVLGSDASFSRLVTATLGITAGSGFAACELRILLHEVIKCTLLAWPTVVISLYVDDATIEVSHPSRRVVQATLAGPTDHVVDGLQVGLELRVSPTKALAVGSSVGIPRTVAALYRTRALTAARSAEMLGVGAAGGRARSTNVLKARIKAFRKRSLRVQKLRGKGWM